MPFVVTSCASKKHRVNGSGRVIILQALTSISLMASKGF